VRTYPDPDHSVHDDRFLAVGQSMVGTLLLVAFTIIGDQPWLINARAVTRAERRRFMHMDEIRDAAIQTEDDDDDLRPFYEFDKMDFVVGKHYFPVLGIRVTLDEDVANDALRLLVSEGRAKKQPPPDRQHVVLG
jgi:hypothetical protein